MNKNKTALITGASSGMGLEFAKIFAREKYDLVLVARDMSTPSFEVPAGVAIRCIAKDLTAPAAAREIMDELAAHGITVDVLVNCAGFGDYGLFHELSLEKQLAMIDLNARVLTELAHRVLGGMVARKSGKILNVASTAAFQPGPLMAVYYATKAYVLSFSEALDNEVRPFGVTVTALCPGPTATGFIKAAGAESTRLFSGKKLPLPAEVAAYGYRSLMQGKRVAIHGWNNWFLAEAVRFIPRSLATSIARSVQEKR